MTPSPSEIALIRFDSIDSTNLHARRLIAGDALPDSPALLVAAEQTGGIGRFGRRWHSPRGGLWCTLVWPLPAGHDGQSVLDGLGLRVGVAALQVIQSQLDRTRSTAQLKWPNDIYVRSKKVCGILCEVVAGARGDRRALVGIGINANFPAAALGSDLATPPTTLLDELGSPVDLNALRESLTTAIATALAERGIPPATLAAAREHLFGVGHSATITRGDGLRIEGILRGLDDRGRAILSTPSGDTHADSELQIHSVDHG